MQLPPHYLPKSSRPPFTDSPLIAPGVRSAPCIALPPPDASIEALWACTMTHDPDDAARIVPRLLALDHPESYAEWHVHLVMLYAAIMHLSPSTAWNEITPSRHAALLHLWKRWLEGITTIHLIGGTKRWMSRLAMRDRFTPLIYLVTTKPTNIHGEVRDKRLRVPAPDNAPTLESTLAAMEELGLRPGYAQIMRLVQVLPLAEVLQCARQDGAFAVTAIRIARELVDPDSLEIHADRDREYLDNRRAPFRSLHLSLGEEALTQLESSVRVKSTSEQHWRNTVARKRNVWRSIVRGYAEAASSREAGDESRAPTAMEIYATWLQLRDVLSQCPRTELRLEPDIVGSFDVNDPIALLQLMAVDSRSQAAQTRLPSAVIRITHAAATRQLFPPVLDLASVMASTGISLHTSTVLYIARAAQYPEDLRALLPYLQRIPTLPPKGDESKDVVVAALLRLARISDQDQALDSGSSGSVTPSPADPSVHSVEATLLALFRKWGLGELIP